MNSIIKHIHLILSISFPLSSFLISPELVELLPYYSMPFEPRIPDSPPNSLSSEDTLFFHPRPKNTPASFPPFLPSSTPLASRAHLGEGRVQVAYRWVRLLLRERVSTRVNEMPRRRPTSIDKFASAGCDDTLRPTQLLDSFIPKAT